jgi:hypothetical protein
LLAGGFDLRLGFFGSSLHFDCVSQAMGESGRVEVRSPGQGMRLRWRGQDDESLTRRCGAVPEET